MTAALLTAVFVSPAQPPAPDPEPLPAAWHGTWAGTLRVRPEAGDPQDLPMALEIRPLADGGGYTFRLTYGSLGKGQVRDYELVPKAGKPGRFEIDEKNGIRLEAKLAGAVLYAPFQVGGSLVLSRYERAGDVLRVEMTACDAGDPTVTKPKGGSVGVKSFPVTSVQTAELRRAER